MNGGFGFCAKPQAICFVLNQAGTFGADCATGNFQANSRPEPEAVKSNRRHVAPQFTHSAMISML